MKRMLLIGAIALTGSLVTLEEASAQGRRGQGRAEAGQRGQFRRGGDRVAVRGGVHVGHRGVSGGARVGFDLGRGSVNFGVNFGSHRGHRGHYRRGPGYRHHHRRAVRVRVPVYEKIWVPPVYRTVCHGYDSCGRPIYRQVCIREGYYRTVIKCYRYETRYH